MIQMLSVGDWSLLTTFESGQQHFQIQPRGMEPAIPNAINERPMNGAFLLWVINCRARERLCGSFCPENSHADQPPRGS
jgi:hypothetical protein